MKTLKTLGFAVCALFCAFVQAETVAISSARHEQMINLLFDAYTKESGLAVSFVTGNLGQVAEQRMLKQVQSAALNANIPAYPHTPGNQWSELSFRARTIIYNTAKLSPKQPSTARSADLACKQSKARPFL